MNNAIAQLEAQAVKEAGLDLYQVDLACGILARTLEKIHGGEWRIQIEEEFIMVARRLRRETALAQPRRGEVV